MRPLYRLCMILILIFDTVLVRINAVVKCRDPMFDIDNTPDSHKKFILLSPPVNGGGIGNQLIFYPAQYVYAILTGRDIVIHDRGLMGELCSVITCGFPFLSQMHAAHPDSFTDEQLKAGRVMKAYDMIREFKGEFEVNNDVAYPAGTVRKSDWWLWMNGTTECVQRITGCGWGDFECMEKYAFQSLIRGPFRSYLTAREEERITGIPKHMRHGILTLPRSFAPRFEIAVHIRAQFHHFESQVAHNDTSYVEEVQTWLNSTQGVSVFDAFEEKIVEELYNLGLYRTADEPAYVYVAADNEDVKDAFISKIEASHPIKIMRIETAGIVHTKDLETMKSMTAGEAGFDLAFDWYALSLSKIILAWRRDTGMRSTFVQTASFVSQATGYYLQSNRYGQFGWFAL
mmetsp:Transcript_1651/g.1730  ORF Transcript_1651/g.1730 Transcript_1651/m.1730 type:complete len:401 (+) Transcript_1651:74-1276(+)